MPDYQEATDEILDMVNALLEQFPEMDAAHARVKYLTKSMKKSKWAGRCHLATGPWKHLAEWDFVIIVWAEWWAGHDDNCRKALLYHELLHIARTEAGTWGLRQHPITEFPEVIEEFGLWSPELACLGPRMAYRK